MSSGDQRDSFNSQANRCKAATVLCAIQKRHMVLSPIQRGWQNSDVKEVRVNQAERQCTSLSVARRQGELWGETVSARM